MARFSDKSIMDIKSRISIVDVVSDYLQVTNKGGKFWIRCPFHNNGMEKTPSCKLDPDKGSFYCFGCHEHGSMFDFVMRMDHVEFPEAVRILAQKAGVELADETDKDRTARDEGNTLSELNERLSNTFHYLLLKDPRGEKALSYLKRRKISDETIEDFCLGYAPSDSNWLYSFLTSKGYSDEFLKKSGYFSVNKFPFPLFRDRLMFPVRSWQGKTVAFGGRDLTFSDTAPKYLNTPDTIIYSKKHNLFGLYQGLDAIKKSGEVTLCEGNFDVISLQQAGIKTAVAPFGTAFTPEQAKLISRYAQKVNLLFDSDTAGQNATAKAIILLQSAGLESTVLHLDGAKDASELLEKEGEATLSDSLKAKHSGFDYLVEKAMNAYNIQTPKGKADVVKELTPFLELTQSQVEMDAYYQHLADLLRVGVEQIAYDVSRAHSSDRSSRHVEVESDGKENETVIAPFAVSRISLDLYAMLLLANHRKLFPRYTKVLRFGDLKDGEAQMIFLALENARREDVGQTDEVFLQLFADAQVRSDVAASFELEEFQAEKNAEDVLDELIERIRMRKMEERRDLIARQIQQGETEGLSSDDFNDLITEKVSLDRDIIAANTAFYNRRKKDE